jgi:serralysin
MSWRSVSYDLVLTDSDQDIDALISGYAWNLAIVDFSFPDSGSDYGYGSANTTNFGQLSAIGQQVVRTALGDVAACTGLGFSEVGDDPGENDAAAPIRVAQTDATGTGFAYYPGGSEQAGDVWVRNTPPAWDGNGFDTPVMGRWGYFSLFHELGHALGLRHGHETGGPGAMTYEHDSMEFSVMTYRSHVGAGTGGYTNESFGFAQSFMMYDIAALQRLYGADFTANAGDTVYSFSATTGEMFVDGVGQGAPGANRIFRTVWDGDGTDTYDLSNYASALDIDLAPGSWSDFSVGATTQNARLGSGVWAQGHLYNALQFQGDARSLIENARGGSAADTISGNAAANGLEGNDGDDRLSGLDGNDALLGGAGQDLLRGGAGRDRLEDGAGQDRSSGGAGADVFAFVRDDVRDTIRDWTSADMIDIGAWGLSGIADLAISTRAAGEVVISEVGGPESILVMDRAGILAAGDLTAADFLFA